MGRKNREIELLKEIEKNKEKLEIIKEEQETLLSLFDKGDSILFKWKNDDKWTIEYVSNNIEKILGYSKSEFLNEDVVFANIILKEDIERVNKEVEKITIEKDYLKHEPYRVITKNNKIKWLLDYTVPVIENDKITHFLGYILDITEQKENEIEKEIHLRLIDENVIYSTTNLKGIIIDVSQAFCKVSGYTKKELLNKNHNIMRHPKTSKDTYKKMW